MGGLADLSTAPSEGDAGPVRRDLMERGTESRSERPRRENGRDAEAASAGAGDPEAAATSGNGSPEAPPETGNGEAGGGSPQTSSGRTALTGRIAREIPAPPRTKTSDGNGDGGNDKPPGDLTPPPAPPGLPGPAGKPRLKKLRLLLVLFGLGLLALVSTVFGMMAAVSRDLPAVYDFAQYKDARNSRIFDDQGSLVGTLTSNENKILLDSRQISQNIKNATVSIEDNRFYQHSGVDFRGIARALVQDVLARSAQQGASTITEQFVENALTAQSSRTVFEKFR
jgi:hypothetical protein